MLLEGDPAESGGWIDLSTGECWPAFTGALGPEPEEQRHSVLRVERATQGPQPVLAPSLKPRPRR
jgi:hypothetical protein